MDDQNLGPAEFVRDLDALCHRYGLVIKGLPYLEAMEPGDRREQYRIAFGQHCRFLVRE